MGWDGMEVGWRGENFCLEIDLEERKGSFLPGQDKSINDLPTTLRRFDRCRRIQYSSSSSSSSD